MANPVELLPLLIVALLMLSAGGADVDTIEIRADGERPVTEIEDVLIVGGGTARVPAGARVEGSVYVIGGDVAIAGRVDGEVVQLAGTLVVAENAAITDELRLFGGERTIASGASIERRTTLPATEAVRSPAEQIGWIAVQTAVVAIAGWAVARRSPGLLRNVGDAVTEHALVSGTVGLLASAAGVALLVFMAITILLLPVSLLGLLVGVLVVAYAHVTLGYLLGRRLPTDSVPAATATGAGGVVLALDVLGRVPVVGDTVRIGATLIGVGAVLITYFGLREFEPAFSE
jgi:hypothetical protein